MKRKILIVDNEADSQIFLSTLLKGNGYEPHHADTAIDGLKKARTIHPDLIIIDLMTPKEGGAQFYYTLKQDKNLKKISVIMLSAAAPKTFFHYQTIGATASGQRIPEPDAFLEKPPEAEDLLHWVDILTLPRPDAPRGDGSSNPRA